MWKWILAGIGAVLIAAVAVVWWAIHPQLVSVGGRRVETRIDGSGAPPVILEAGFTGGRLQWWPVEHAVSKETLTLAYERAGLGRSDTAEEPRDAEHIALELHDLLETLQLKPPYVLVGHSAGGLYVRVFAHRYPTEIAGLVLVDPATEEYYERIRSGKSADDLSKAGLPAGAIAQWRALSQSLEQARNSWPLPSVPTVVLTSGMPLKTWPLESQQDMEAWSRSHLDLLAQLPGSKHVLLPSVDHLAILRERAVVDEILRVVEVARRQAAQ
jgi:pimeloyl-ACP methyl ester carboxylesterase